MRQPDDIRGRVGESRAQRESDASRVPELWAMAEELSRGGHYSPRTASAVYRELLRAYKLRPSVADMVREAGLVCLHPSHSDEAGCKNPLCFKFAWRDRCEEASGSLGSNLVVWCHRPTTTLVQHAGRAEGPYFMCEACAEHNTRHRDAFVVMVRVAGNIGRRP